MKSKFHDCLDVRPVIFRLISFNMTIYNGGTQPDSLEYNCKILFPLWSIWKEADISFKFILLTSFPTTDNSYEFQADVIKLDQLKQGECNHWLLGILLSDTVPPLPHTSLKFILLTSFPTTDKSCDFLDNIILLDHLKQGERILTAWNPTM